MKGKELGRFRELNCIFLCNSPPRKMTNLVTKSSYVLETLGKRSTKVSCEDFRPINYILNFDFMRFFIIINIIATRRIIANVPSVEQQPTPAKLERTRTHQLFTTQRRGHSCSQIRRSQNREGSGQSSPIPGNHRHRHKGSGVGRWSWIRSF